MNRVLFHVLDLFIFLDGMQVKTSNWRINFNMVMSISRELPDHGDCPPFSLGL